MGEWKRIDEEKPQQGQAVYYWFGVFDRVYAGFFKTTCPDDWGTPDDEPVPEEMRDPEWVLSCFYGRGGYLCDDVTWWMPRMELPEGVTFMPAGPTDFQKSQCRYHPVPMPETPGFGLD